MGAGGLLGAASIVWRDGEREPGALSRHIGNTASRVGRPSRLPSREAKKLQLPFCINLTKSAPHTESGVVSETSIASPRSGGSAGAKQGFLLSLLLV